MATDKNTIQSYDAYALKWAERMRSGKNLAHTFLEKPAMYQQLPNLKGKSVLCIGCGTGEECAHLQSRGAKKVIGIDISKGLIDYAKTSYPNLAFHVMDMEQLDFPEQTFDFVYSSLTMHYIDNWLDTLRGIHRILKQHGTFLFSTHHPMTWGAEVTRMSESESRVLGYEKHTSGEYTVFGDYFNARKVDDVWFNEFHVSYYHRPLSAIIKDIRDSGFVISDILEPKPLASVIEENSNFYAIYGKIPLFMIFELTKPV